MNIVALDTSTEYCSVALWCGGPLLADGCLAGQRHSELLLPMLHALLEQADMRLAQFDAVAFGAGPGSFTGLRIACGVAQGLAFGADLPVAAVPTLLAMAHSLPDQRVVACLDARMGEVYHAAYQKQDGEWQALHEPSLCLPQDAPQLTDGAEQPWVGCGSGFAAYGAALQARYATLARIEPQCLPHAKEIACLAAPLIARGAGMLPELAAPLYVRDKVALKMSER